MSYKIKNIYCIGVRICGGPTMSVIANNCPDLEVNVVDVNKTRIDDWNNTDLRKLPIFEPDYKIIEKCRGRTCFSLLLKNNSLSRYDFHIC